MRKGLVVLVLTVVVSYFIIGCDKEPDKIEGDNIYITQTTPDNPIDEEEVIYTNWPDIYQSSIMSVPKIEIMECTLYRGPEGFQTCYPVGHGTGFIVADGIVATNYHVAEIFFSVNMNNFPNSITYYELNVKYPETNTLSENTFITANHFVTSVATYLSPRDLAFLKVETLGRPPLPINTSGFTEIQLFDEVMAMGYPLDFDFVATLGLVEDTLINESWTIPWVMSDTKLLKTSAEIDMGNSGGPLLNDSGEVIGVNFASIIGNNVHNMAISANHLGEYDLETFYYSSHSFPNPNEYTSQLIVDIDSEINPENEEEWYSFNYSQACYYSFKSSGISDFGDPVATWLFMYDSSGGLVWDRYAPFYDIYNTYLGSWSPAQTGIYDLRVVQDSWYTWTVGWYNLQITESCKAP
ncbi:S1C family serine protease [Patescibacteria group bacterium]